MNTKIKTKIPETSFEDFCAFVRRSLECWKAKFHNWSEADQKLLDHVSHGVEDFIWIEFTTTRDISALLEDFERTYGLVVPIMWGAWSDVYFKNWSNLKNAFKNEEV